jgi:uncharacterized protein YchJ
VLPPVPRGRARADGGGADAVAVLGVRARAGALPPRHLVDVDLALDDGLEWRRLQIVDTARGGADDDEGIVEFRAAHRSAEGAGVLHERSRFARQDGRWVYVDGDLLD